MKSTCIAYQHVRDIVASSMMSITHTLKYFEDTKEAVNERITDNINTNGERFLACS
jgi:hypothetical protein